MLIEWTAKDRKAWEILVEKLMAKNFSREQAWAIATALLLKIRKRDGETSE